MRRLRAAEAARPIIFGEVLFDQFPDESVVLGGAPLNVAWNLRGLGFDPLFISRVGDDALGERIRRALAGQDLDSTAIQVDPRHATGTVSVRLEGGQPSFEIAPERAYDFIEQTPHLDLDGAGLLYSGSLALRNEVSRASFISLQERAGLPLFVDVNLRAPWYSRDLIDDLLSRAQYVKLNDDELALLAERGVGDDAAAEALLDERDLELLCITRGAHGADCWTRDRGMFSVKPESDVRVVDTVGAGDAFSSVMLAGLLARWPLAETLQRAQELASAVVGIRGATSTDPDFYASLRRRWSLE